MHGLQCSASSDNPIITGINQLQPKSLGLAELANGPFVQFICTITGYDYPEPASLAVDNQGKLRLLSSGLRGYIEGWLGESIICIPDEFHPGCAA